MVVVIVWSLDLQLHMQLVPMTNRVVGSLDTDTTLCEKCVSDIATGRWFSSGSPVSSINKTCSHDIAEILLKVALNTIHFRVLILHLESHYPSRTPIDS